MHTFFYNSIVHFVLEYFPGNILHFLNCQPEKKMGEFEYYIYLYFKKS